MGSARPSARRYREALMECAAAFSAIAAFSAGVTHTLTGLDSRRVFSFLASSISNFEAVAAPLRRNFVGKRCELTMKHVEETPDVQGSDRIAGFHADEPAPFGSGTARHLRSL